MKANYPAFIQEEVSPLIISDLNTCRDKIVKEVTDNLFIKKIKPCLLAFRQNGGKLVNLKREIAMDVSDYKPDLTQKIDEIYQTNIIRLYQTTLEKTRTWLLKDGLKLSDSQNINTDRQGGAALDGKTVDPEIAESITTTIGLVVGTIGALIVASICGGGGMALIAVGPIGWLIGLIIGGGAGLAAYVGTKEKARGIMENIDISHFVLYPILTDAKIQDCQRKLQEDLINKLDGKNKTITGEIRGNLEKVIQLEIDKLSELNVVQ